MRERSPYQRITFSMGGPLTAAVKVLLILNTAFFLLQTLSNRVLGLYLDSLLGLVPYLVVHRFFLWQVVTYMFLHGGLLHIAFNLLALWMFGGELERIWGPRFFLKYYLLCGIGAGICATIVHPASPVPTIGASGAIYGILLAYGLLFPNRQILLWFMVPMKAKHFVWLVGFLAFYASITTPGSSVSNIAHLGGLLFGYFYLRGWGLFRRIHSGYLEWKLKRLKKRYRVVQGKGDKDQDPSVN
jgi:membrane associated rhomboid family serine protease